MPFIIKKSDKKDPKAKGKFVIKKKGKPTEKVDPKKDDKKPFAARFAKEKK